MASRYSGGNDDLWCIGSIVFTVVIPALVEYITGEIEVYHAKVHAADFFNSTTREKKAKQTCLGYTIQTEMYMQWIDSAAEDCAKELNFNHGSPFASFCENSFEIDRKKDGQAMRVISNLYHLNTVERWCAGAFPDIAKQASHDYQWYISSTRGVENWGSLARMGHLYNVSKPGYTAALTPFSLEEFEDEYGIPCPEAHKN